MSMPEEKGRSNSPDGPGPLFRDTAARRLRLERDLVFLDTATTGADISMDRIVQLALVRLRPDGSREEYETLVNPEMEIPLEAERIHGITNEMVAFAPPFRRLAPELLERLSGADLAGFNLLRFDLPLLKSEFERSGHPWDPSSCRVLDVQVLFHRMEPRDLTAAYRFYCGKTLEGAHGALVDTRATLEVLQAQVARYAELPDDVAGLDRLFNQPDARFVDSHRRFYWRNNEATFNFGNRRGQTLREVASSSPDYLRWILERDFPSEVKGIVASALEGRFPEPPAQRRDQDDSSSS